jgi:hypothetical protein
MDNVGLAGSPARHPRRVRYRVEQLDADHFAVVERLSGDRVVEAEFDTYTAAWTWIANHV